MDRIRKINGGELPVSAGDIPAKRFNCEKSKRADCASVIASDNQAECSDCQRSTRDCAPVLANGNLEENSD